MNTGKTDLRDTEVQQPNTTATLSCVIKPRAFSANNGQLEAGSTTTGSSILPMTPPLALISSMVIKATFLSEVSEIAIVPESEWRIPTLMVSAAKAERINKPGADAAKAPSAVAFNTLRRSMFAAPLRKMKRRK